jgi:hypothetical protein
LAFTNEQNWHLRFKEVDGKPQWRDYETVHILDDPCLLGQQHYGYCETEWIRMPTYGFKSEDGTVVDRKFNYDEEVPQEIEEDGIKYKRVWAFQGFRIR